MRYHRSPAGTGGFSLVEAMFAVGLVATSFISLYTMSSQCLYFTNRSREVVRAGQTAQTRLEQMRTCTFAQVTDPNYLKNNIFNASVIGASTLGTVTEIVTINAYPTPVTPAIQLTRAADGTVAIDSTNSAIATSSLASVNLQLTWKAPRSTRSRTIGVSTVCGVNAQ